MCLHSVALVLQQLLHSVGFKLLHSVGHKQREHERARKRESERARDERVREWKSGRVRARECVRKNEPDFFEETERLGAKIAKTSML